jgi:4-amino-4-deoxychorismate lyase
MSCFETIKSQNSLLHHINYHNARLNKTRAKLYNATNPINLRDFITTINSKELFRCKVTYSKEIERVEFFEYKVKEFKSFKFINIDFDYKFKYLDRSLIDSSSKAGFDDVIFIKRGFITDTSIANIAIFDGINWISPKKPLLNGTTVTRLSYKLKRRDLTIKDILNSKRVAILNAMLGFKDLGVTRKLEFEK